MAFQAANDYKTTNSESVSREVLTPDPDSTNRTDPHGGSNPPPVTVLTLSGRPGDGWDTTVFQDWAILVPPAIHCSWPIGPSNTTEGL